MPVAVRQFGVGRGLAGRTLQSFSDAAISITDPRFTVNADGATDDLETFETFSATPDVIKIIPPGEYKLSADWVPVAGDYSQLTSPGVTFVTSRPDFENVIPYQGSPGDLWAPNLFAKTYGDDWAGFGNIFNLGSFVDAAITTVPIVAVFGEGDASVSGARAWGGNFVGFASASGAVSIATEFNFGVLASGGTAYGAVLAAAGDFATANYIQLQTNTDAATAANGIVFNNTTYPSVDGAYFTTTGTTGGVAQRLMYFNNVEFTSSEWESKSFIVGPSPATATANWNRIRIDHSTTGNPSIKAVSTDSSASNLNLYSSTTGSIQFLTGTSSDIQVAITNTETAPDYLTLTGGSGSAVISVAGTTTNASVLMQGKGTGGIIARDGAGTTRIQVTTSGIGFYGVTPVSRGGAGTALDTGGAETNTNICTRVNQLRTALINVGICVAS